jgi:hypothetical protein
LFVGQVTKLFFNSSETFQSGKTKLDRSYLANVITLAYSSAGKASNLPS